MNEDFVFNQIYKGALAAGAKEKQAKDHAVMGLNDYKKGKFQGKASKLIEDRIKQAKRKSK